MFAQITFTDRERELVVELLEREQGFLPHEIHHTDSREFRAGLQERLELVGTLLNKVAANVEQPVAR